MNATILAVAPAMGVRVHKQRGAYRVHAIDQGGRGYPWAAVLVPVGRCSNGRYGVLVDGEPVQRKCTSQELKLDQRWKRLRDKKGSYLLKVLESNWPAEAEELVLFLLYFQSIDGKGQRYADEVCDAVHAALARPVDELRSGVIQQPPIAANKAKAPIGGEVCFALASCQYPADIFDRMPDGDHDRRGPADASMLRLGDLFKGIAAPPPSLVLLVGDQVYVDATAGLFDPKAADDRFRIPYEQWLASRGAHAVFNRLDVDVRTMLDDHEIGDNWEPGDEPARQSNEPSTLAAGCVAYREFQRRQLVNRESPPEPADKAWKTLYGHFATGGLRFFLTDTRTQREPRTASDLQMRRIMGEEQFDKLIGWLEQAEDQGRPSFVVSSSALLPRRLAIQRNPACALHSDAWDGYPRSLHETLAFICDKELNNIVFLSGDEHLSYVAKAGVKHLRSGKQADIYSVHSSALYAPYPFANGRPENFARCETFGFDHPCTGERYECTVQTCFPEASDGFALLTARQDQGGWALDVCFRSARHAGSRGYIVLPF